MKRRILIVLLAGPLLLGLPTRYSLRGQTCTDDEGMVKSYVQSITDLIDTVKKENLPDFEKAYHEQSCLTRLTLALGIVNSLIDCLNKAAKDPAATQEQIAAIKTKLQSYTKLKSTLEQDHESLKAAKDTKTAKALIEKFVIST
ncbi:MAG TPA: hypothetical protein VFC10_10665 [Terriglobia bacterium]|jgi:hypothetical protein|nr:hypothetical protein [Terriglobia bacterium]